MWTVLWATCAIASFGAHYVRFVTFPRDCRTSCETLGGRSLHHEILILNIISFLVLIWYIVPQKESLRVGTENAVSGGGGGGEGAGEWRPSGEWVASWRARLPLQTIMRLLQVLVPQVEKICIDKWVHTHTDTHTRSQINERIPTQKVTQTHTAYTLKLILLWSPNKNQKCLCSCRLQKYLWTVILLIKILLNHLYLMWSCHGFGIMIL